MDIVNILEKLVHKYNESDCGLCWKIVLGGRSDYFNNERDQPEKPADFWGIQPDENCDNCCVRLGVLRIANTSGFQVTGEDGAFVTKQYTDWTLQLFAGIPSRLDLQFYNEVRPEETEQSKWVKYIRPIQCCMTNTEVEICDLHNCCGCETTVEVRAWNMEMRLNYSDRNMDGWNINATFREWLQ